MYSSFSLFECRKVVNGSKSSEVGHGISFHNQVVWNFSFLLYNLVHVSMWFGYHEVEGNAGFVDVFSHKHAFHYLCMQRNTLA